MIQGERGGGRTRYTTRRQLRIYGSKPKEDDRMKPLEASAKNTRPLGPSYGEPQEKNVSLSAAQLASLANVLPQDIEYWARKDLLPNEKGSKSGNYQLSQLPKAQLMGLFSKRLQIKAKKASQLADDVLALYKDRPDAFQATIAMVQALESRITEFVSLILDMNLVEQIGELLAEKKVKRR